MAKKTKKVETIDLTPTWTEILPALLAIWDKSEGGKNIAMGELRKMAKLADLYNEMVKAA
jgi:hypothetical protein